MAPSTDRTALLTCPRRTPTAGVILQVSRDSPHRILPRYIVLRGRPASIHTFRPDTDPSNYAPHAKRIDISMITSIELGIGEDKCPEAKVFKNWQNTILKNNFFFGNGKAA